MKLFRYSYRKLLQERQGKAIQENGAKHNTTHPMQSFFKEKLATSGEI